MSHAAPSTITNLTSVC